MGDAPPSDLRDRTKRFALRVMRLVDAMPKTITGRAIASQIVRSGTSVAANYRAAQRARSRKEFVAKLGIVEEEADETALWLELIMDDTMLPRDRVEPLHDEAGQIVAMIVTAIRSARERRD